MGRKPDKIEIMPFGVSISFKINIKEYNKKIKKANILEIKKIIVALAGPVTNFIIILIAGNLNFVGSILAIYTNFLIMIFNMLPIYPLDGGRILKGILHIVKGKMKAEKYSNFISNITAIIIISISSILILYVQNISIFLIDIYIVYLVIKENFIYKKREEIYKKILENNMI